MKLGANSVLFGGHTLESAFKYIAMAGYDGIELSAINGMSEHLVLGRWQELVTEIKQLSHTYALELLSIEQPSLDCTLMEQAFHAALELGIPIVNCGSGGKSADDEAWPKVLDSLGSLAMMAERYGVTLCVKAHVGASIHDTPTTLLAIQQISSPAFAIDMDPSHIHRAGEDPVDAISAVISQVKHVHIRDCEGRGHGPGTPENQSNGRGEINLVGYIRVLHEYGYSGPINLEIIGAKDYDIAQCSIIAAESRGHMQACLQACNAR